MTVLFTEPAKTFRFMYSHKEKRFIDGFFDNRTWFLLRLYHVFDLPINSNLEKKHP